MTIVRRRPTRWCWEGAATAAVLGLLVAGCATGADAPERGPTGPGSVAPGTVTGSPARQVEVLSEVGQGRTSTYRQLAVVALGEVEDLWGAGAVARPVLLRLPADAASFAELTGHPTEVQDTPATTVGTGVDASIVVHPDAWDRLTPEGRQAVLTHEMTHLAMQGDGPVPRWVGEGLAEYTAHRGSSLPLTAIAGSALDPVRSGAVPAQWPDPLAVGDRWRGYAMSWLACVFIARDHSERDLVRLYQVLEGGATLEAAVPEVLGVSEQRLRRDWADWLQELVGGQGLE